MTLIVRTAHLSRGPVDYLNVMRADAERRKAAGGHRGMGEAFAPSRSLLSRYLQLSRAGELTDQYWLAYVKAFTEEMRVSYVQKRAAWDKLLSLASVTLCCTCREASRCHRSVLAGPDILQKLGAKYAGELT